MEKIRGMWYNNQSGLVRPHEPRERQTFAGCPHTSQAKVARDNLMSNFLMTLSILALTYFGSQMMLNTDNGITSLMGLGLVLSMAGLALADDNQVKRQPRRRRPTAGYVYLLKTSIGVWKIGRTRNPENRLKTFEVKLPYEVEYECLIKTENMYHLESELHQQFSHKRRYKTEFFNLSDEDVAYIKSIANGHNGGQVQ